MGITVFVCGMVGLFLNTTTPLALSFLGIYGGLLTVLISMRIRVHKIETATIEIEAATVENRDAIEVLDRDKRTLIEAVNREFSANIRQMAQRVERIEQMMVGRELDDAGHTGQRAAAADHAS